MTKEQIRERKDKILEDFERETYVARHLAEKLSEQMIDLGREIERGNRKGGLKLERVLEIIDETNFSDGNQGELSMLKAKIKKALREEIK